MKTERRHELETNALAEWMGRFIEGVRPYRNYFLAALVIAVVLVLVGAYTARQAQSRTTEAWTALGSVSNPQDFAKIASQYPDTLAAKWAKLRLADSELIQGVELLFRNREDALVRLRSAQRLYGELSENSTGLDLLDQRALMGLARSYEALGELDAARPAYQAIIDRFPAGALAEDARARLDELSDPEVAGFYQWLEAHPPVSTAPAESSSGGESAGGEGAAEPVQVGTPAENEAAPATTDQEQARPAPGEPVGELPQGRTDTGSRAGHSGGPDEGPPEEAAPGGDASPRRPGAPDSQSPEAGGEAPAPARPAESDQPDNPSHQTGPQ